MTHERGSVVWSTDPFKRDPEAGRPWLVVSNETQPFGDEQAMTIALSTSGHDEAITIDRNAWIEGGVPNQSYALPWAVHTVQTVDVQQRLGRLSPTFVDEAVARLEEYVAPR
ncbi:MAG: mRNA-degrading endonuclease toxin of MazEF toxin-antitoxin module [Haloarculaceae archaeon]|jgi:mRNA-degrading endonuclease toxin of MazEF toxin-antitoxin module